MGIVWTKIIESASTSGRNAAARDRRFGLHSMYELAVKPADLDPSVGADDVLSFFLALAFCWLPPNISDIQKKWNFIKLKKNPILYIYLKEDPPKYPQKVRHNCEPRVTAANG